MVDETTAPVFFAMHIYRHKSERNREGQKIRNLISTFRPQIPFRYSAISSCIFFASCAAANGKSSPESA